MNFETLSSAIVLIANVATIVGAVGVVFAVQQLRLSKKLAQSAFEDELTREYRSIVKDIPMDALLGAPLAKEQKEHVRELIYNYIDLCNQQVFLRMKGRITDDTWLEWSAGMQSTLRLGPFLEVWDEIQGASPDIFNELRRLTKCGFQKDPKMWQEDGQ